MRPISRSRATFLSSWDNARTAGIHNLAIVKLMMGNWLSKVVPVVSTLVLLPVLAASALSCGEKIEAGEKIGVVVTVLPQAEFVVNVGGERVDVSIMVSPGASPHTYEPTPSQLAALSIAKIYAKAGSRVDFELVWMDKLVAANEKMLVVDCSNGIQLIEMSGKHTREDEEYEHGAMDPHIWLSPLNAKIMVQNIYEGLVQVDPDNRTYYEQNRDAYLQKLTKLDHDIRDGMSGVTNRSFMVYHPAFGYFARDYNLNMLPIEEEGKEPTAAGIARLIEQAKGHKINVIFVSPQFNPESAKVIAREIGGKVVFVDPLAGDYIMNLYKVLGELVQMME
ncbi:metal ABC transporter solute-binding protein, Zn/Mn family [Chloroflexota bacterium]